MRTFLGPIPEKRAPTRQSDPARRYGPRPRLQPGPAPRRAARAQPSAETERAGVVAVHADRVDPSVVRGDAWHFTARQLEHLVDLSREERRAGGASRPADAAPTPAAAPGQEAAA